MSMIFCESCHDLIDSDDDPDCFVEIGNLRRLRKEIVMCAHCRDRYEKLIANEPSV